MEHEPREAHTGVDAGQAIANAEDRVRQAGSGIGERASAVAIRKSVSRKRKASLTKKAVIGTSRFLRERRNSSRSSSSVIARGLNMDSTFTASGSKAERPKVPITSATQTESQLPTPRSAHTAPYLSTTEGDEATSFLFQNASTGSSAYSSKYPQSSTQPTPVHRRRSHRAAQPSSLMTVQTPSDLALEDEWDYSETEWWGWVVLGATWLVFVVGIGSTLDLWSWAWDVGETPYAPPDLEDDPTLPITGYYPALLVCTAVMSWVWVVIAWVGMKYFRHSKEG